ncbi:metal ABC transporter ATP-binding protein [Candidatus Peregrinibacteria bacterium]|nr:metal ABC transporter ATP-binding protein [Candidatus Peregrinibacteria bacterium]
MWPMNEPLVEFRSVSIERTGQNVLEHVSLEIFRNEIVTVIGLNGAGKTTLLKAMLGIYKPTRGKIILRTKKIGYVPQKLQFDRTIPFSVLELLRMYSGKGADVVFQKSQEIQAEKLLEKKVGELSGGELQRVLLVNALLADPELLLLDEATSGIDVRGEQQFYTLIQQLHQTYRMAIVMVSHDIHTVFAQASRVFCLNRTLCCHGAPQDVSQNPEFVKLFGSYLAPYKHDSHD